MLRRCELINPSTVADLPLIDSAKDKILLEAQLTCMGSSLVYARVSQMVKGRGTMLC
jgi:hypothetical protein